MWIVDGSMGEGGGQVLRTMLTLSLVTGSAFHITKIRAGRTRPGVMRQHLVAVEAAAAIGAADVSGAEIGSTEIVFTPKGIRAGDYSLPLGGAGSTTLVFQTVLLPLLMAKEKSVLRFAGGTHNPMAPPMDFLRETFLPLLARMGAPVDVAFERPGFYPAGGGAWSATVHPTPALSRLELLERGAVTGTRATALLAQLAPSIAVRELDALAAALGWDREVCKPSIVPRAHGPGNALLAFVVSEALTEVFTGFGERGVSAESVAQRVASEVARYLRAGVPVGEHLADQLLLPLALGAGGCLRTVKPSLHTETQMELLARYLGTTITAQEESNDVWRIDVPARAR